MTIFFAISSADFKEPVSLTSLKKGDIGSIFNAAFEAQYTLIPATACWNSEIGAIFTVVWMAGSNIVSLLFLAKEMIDDYA
ncbi:hypothetical protein [Paenibacillus sp. V4I7]|uniref:hypothetical protein n=1 Tax=Paenibacillus sp. V4I7 TaxID=3042307 RepID=UPI00278333CD|nr:hypothetical protein [Paenibacillus sp. V4I7]MDQ0897585.1 hypothetical protein [Paenibacillus sp. V4I7]